MREHTLPQLEALGDGLCPIQRFRGVGRVANDAISGSDAQPGVAALLIVGCRFQCLLEGFDRVGRARDLAQQLSTEHGKRVAKLTLLRELPTALRQSKCGVASKAMCLLLGCSQVRRGRFRILCAIQVLCAQHRLTLAVPRCGFVDAARACGCSAATSRRPPG